MLLESGCPPQDPDKLDQLQMKLDHLLEQETNLLLQIRENHCPRKENWSKPRRYQLDSGFGYESEFEQQRFGRLSVLPYYREASCPILIESYFLIGNCFDYLHEDSELEENQEVEFDLRPSKVSGWNSYDKK
ncbi:hypothetical protein Tco_0385773 [Tanacetum coccineum]